jgi:tyrosinase
MEKTKREVLLQGAVFGAGVIACNVPGLTALAEGQPPRRRSLEGLAWNDPIVATYRDAVGILKQRPASEQFSWVNLASIHGSDPDTYHFCPHGNWYFLPWHRAYTTMYERIIRHLTKNDAFALPYWDWTANPLMPEVFLKPKTPDGKTNWLYDADANWERTWPPADPMPAENVGPDVLKKILAASDYETFGTSRPQGQDSLDPSWITTGTGTQDELEGNAHNNVHNNIGGWMPSASSPRDPIFFMHHSNIDRIWAVWNQNNPNSADPLWTNMPFTENFYNINGSFWSPKVSDLYVPETLGYTYGLTAVAAAIAPAGEGKVIALRNKLTTLFAAPHLADVKAEGITTVIAANTETAKPGQPLELAVSVPQETVRAISRQSTPGSAGNTATLAAPREGAESSTRAIVFLRDVVVTQAQNTQYRVFIDIDTLSAATPITDPHYVGTFGIFNHGTHSHHAAPSFAIDLTSALQRVYGSGKEPTGNIRLLILPVASSHGREPGTATPARIEVTFVSA